MTDQTSRFPGSHNSLLIKGRIGRIALIEVLSHARSTSVLTPDGITGRVLRSCADQLAGLFTSIFNESLATSVVPTSFKKSVIIPVPKNSKPSCLNDSCPVALTSIVMKVFERLLKNHICSSIPVTLDTLQFAYRPNRPTDDAISQVLHSSLTHIDGNNGNYVGLLFIDYSSAFNTIVPTKLAVKLTDLGLNSSLCDWILLPSGGAAEFSRL